MATDTASTTGGDILARGSAFGLSVHHVSDADPDLWRVAETAVATVREHSQLTISETATTSTLDIASGRIEHASHGWAAAAGAQVRVQLERVARAHDVVAQDAGGARLGDGLVDDALDVLELAAQIDVALVRTDREPGEDHALDQQVRVQLHELAVLERARLRLVGIDHKILGLFRILGDKSPLCSAGKTGSATAAKPGGVDSLDNPGRGGSIGNDVPEGLPGAAREGLLKRSGGRKSPSARR